VFAARRQRFREAMGEDAVAILVGSHPVTRSADTEFPFRQDSDVWYLTGYDHPNAIALLRTDGGPEYTLYVEPRDPTKETWTGYRPGIEGAVRDYGADESFATSEFEKHLPELLGKVDRVYHVLGRKASIDAVIVETTEALHRRSRQGVSPPKAIVDPRAVLHEMRLFKAPEELDLMRRAAAISAQAHLEAARMAVPGCYEYELEAVIEYTFRRRGARGPAYTSIVGGGANATVLHYVRNDQKLSADTMVLIDAGCELEGYASDVTRTYPVGGRFDDAGREIYEVVLTAQDEALAKCVPGSTLPAIHDAAVEALVDGMLALGVLSGDAATLIEEERHRPYYMHGTSHWLGLDVHDVGSYRQEGEPRKLEPGMVFTVEPGLYFAPEQDDVPARYRGIGVRIEDNVVITDGGHENLTAAIPKAPDELESLVDDG
jgi:Xaa-Pro aminopeptidase